MAFPLKALSAKAEDEAAIVSRLLWALFGLSAAVATVAAALAGLRFAHGGAFLPELAACLGVLMATRWYSGFRGVGGVRLRLWLDIFASFSATSLANLVIAYASATVPAPDATAFVQHFDGAFGFHWNGYARTVSGMPLVSSALSFFYRNWMTQMLAAMTALTLVGDFVAIGEFAIASTVAFLAIAAIFACVDVRSLESVAAYGLSNLHHPSGAGPNYLHTLQLLRSGADRTVDFDHIAGLISFPSLHGASALLLVAATRSLGPWRYPFFAFNVLVLVSTLSEGGHDATDVIAGVAVALAAIAVSPALYRAFARRLPTAVAPRAPEVAAAAS